MYTSWTIDDQRLESLSPSLSLTIVSAGWLKEEEEGKETMVVITIRTLHPTDSLQRARSFYSPS